MKLMFYKLLSIMAAFAAAIHPHRKDAEYTHAELWYSSEEQLHRNQVSSRSTNMPRVGSSRLSEDSKAHQTGAQTRRRAPRAARVRKGRHREGPSEAHD